MSDPTETIRREMVNEINRIPGSREDLEAKYGVVWDTSEMVTNFECAGFLAPLTFVIRRSDRANGTLMFQHNPRFYFNFVKG
jgi:hypothetical protein